MNEKILEIFDEYLDKLKKLMEYRALMSLPNAILRLKREIMDSIPEIIIDYPLFSPISIEPLKVNMSNFNSKFDELENKYFVESCIEKLISTYEMYLFDIMKEVYIQYPMKIASSKQVKVSEVLSTPNREELMYLIISKEIDEIKYQSMEKWHIKLCELFGIPEISKGLIESLVELKSTRDVIVHNNSKINEIYLYKAKGKSRGVLNDTVDCTGDYFKESWSTVVSAMVEIKDKIIIKYPKLSNDS